MELHGRSFVCINQAFCICQTTPMQHTLPFKPGHAKRKNRERTNVFLVYFKQISSTHGVQAAS